MDRIMDLEGYYVDFSSRDNLTSEDKDELERIQKNFFPLDRIDVLLPFLMAAKITSDDYEKMTGLPYQCDPYGLSGIE